MPSIDMSNTEIKTTVEALGKEMMIEGCHGYKDYPGRSILEAASMQVTKNKAENNAAISLIGVVLGANRNWEKAVQPKLDALKISEKYKEMTFKDLRRLLEKYDYVGFKAIWGHKDEKKYNTLKELVKRILAFAKANPQWKTDSDVMSGWARDAKLDDRKNDILGSIPNVGIATFQHLRLTYGEDTVKPDQRVMEVLKVKFGKKLSPTKAIGEVEAIAKITGHSVVMIDQIFVKYGSGYLRKN